MNRRDGSDANKNQTHISFFFFAIQTKVAKIKYQAFFAGQSPELCGEGSYTGALSCSDYHKDHKSIFNLLLSTETGSHIGT